MPDTVWCNILFKYTYFSSIRFSSICALFSVFILSCVESFGVYKREKSFNQTQLQKFCSFITTNLWISVRIYQYQIINSRFKITPNFYLLLSNQVKVLFGRPNKFDLCSSSLKPQAKKTTNILKRKVCWSNKTSLAFYKNHEILYLSKIQPYAPNVSQFVTFSMNYW